MTDTTSNDEPTTGTVYGVVLDEQGSTDIYDTEAEARAHATADTPLVRITTTPLDEPVRIEDMAPGTTFTAQFHGEWDRFFRCRDSVARAGRYLVAMDAIDPSTVRDVTPPHALPEDGR